MGMAPAARPDLLGGCVSEATPFDLAIHQRLLDGDLTARALLCETYLETVRRDTAGIARRWQLSTDDHWDVVSMSCFKYCRNPGKYQPEKMALVRYLVMDAYGDIQTMGERLARARQRIVRLDAVAHALDARNSEQDGFDAIEHEDVSAELRALMEMALPDPVDRKLAELIVDGRTTTAECAILLGIAHLDSREQAKVVNRRKDKVKKRLKRIGEKLYGTE